MPKSGTLAKELLEPKYTGYILQLYASGKLESCYEILKVFTSVTPITMRNNPSTVGGFKAC